MMTIMRDDRRLYVERTFQLHQTERRTRQIFFPHIILALMQLAARQIDSFAISHLDCLSMFWIRFCVLSSSLISRSTLGSCWSKYLSREFLHSSRRILPELSSIRLSWHFAENITLKSSGVFFLCCAKNKKKKKRKLLTWVLLLSVSLSLPKREPRHSRELGGEVNNKLSRHINSSSRINFYYFCDLSAADSCSLSCRVHPFKKRSPKRLQQLHPAFLWSRHHHHRRRRA